MFLKHVVKEVREALGTTLPLPSITGGRQTKDRRLWTAAGEGDLLTVRLLANDRHVDINYVGEEKRDTPLHRACRFGHTEIVQELLRHPRVDVNKGNAGNASPFFIACQEAHREIVLALVADSRVEVNRPDMENVTPLCMASNDGSVEVVRVLLADPRTDPSVAKVTGVTALSIACERGHEEVVTLLLEDVRVDPNTLDTDMSSPLWFAAQNGHLLVSHQLLASDRVIDTQTLSQWNRQTAGEQARAMANHPRMSFEGEVDADRRRTCCPAIADLLDCYKEDPNAVRMSLRTIPPIRGEPSFPLLLL